MADKLKQFFSRQKVKECCIPDSRKASPLTTQCKMVGHVILPASYHGDTMFYRVDGVCCTPLQISD